MQLCRVNVRGHPRLTWLMTIERFNVPWAVCCYALDPLSCENFCMQAVDGMTTMKMKLTMISVDVVYMSD